MNTKLKVSLFVGGVIACAGALLMPSAPKLFTGLRAAGNTTWKHFSAVMPTATESGVREYWIDCAGGGAIFEEPKDILAVDAVLTSDQIASIRALNDERLIHSINDINRAMNSLNYGVLPEDDVKLNIANDYNYLDSQTKALITNAENLEFANQNYNSRYSTFKTASELIGFDNKVNQRIVYDSTYGDVVELSKNTSTAEGWSFKGIQGISVEGNYVVFYIYVDLPTDLMITNWTYYYDMASSSIVTESPKNALTAKKWNKIQIKCEDLNTMGNIDIALYTTASAGYGISGTGNPAKISSMYVVNNVVGDFRTAVLEHSGWGSMTATVGGELDPTYGPLTTFTVDTAGEVRQYSFDNTYFGDYDYVTMSVYCPAAKSDFFVQTGDYSQGVLYPDGTFSNILTENTGYLKAGWNEIKMNAELFKTAKYFSIVDTKNRVSAGSVYKVTRVVGHYFDQLDELEEKITALPEAANVNAYTYNSLKVIGEMVKLVNTNKLSNYQKYLDVKAAWDAKYYLIYDPTAAAKMPSCGGNGASSATFELAYDETYGNLLKINAVHTTAHADYQIYFYTSWGATRDANDKIHVSVMSPFATPSGTTQSIWYGASNSERVSLKQNQFVEFSGTLTELTAGESTVETTTFSQSFTLQWYKAGTTEFTGTYYMTCIFGEIID